MPGYLLLVFLCGKSEQAEQKQRIKVSNNSFRLSSDAFC